MLNSKNEVELESLGGISDREKSYDGRQATPESQKAINPNNSTPSSTIPPFDQSSQKADAEGVTDHDNPEFPDVSRSRAFVIIFLLTGVSFLNTMGSGILTVALPTIARDIGLKENLLLWPASVYALSAGCTLLIFGSVADVVGSKRIWLTGAGLYIAFTLACGLAKTGIELIIFRTILGIAISMCLPSAVSVTTNSFPRGKRRNIGFACMGMGQPLGYSLGLILGGVFTNTIGWRWGYYLSAILNAVLFAGAFWGLPAADDKNAVSWGRLVHEIDWIGALVISISLGLLSYVLAMVTASYSRLRDPPNIALLVVGIVLIPAFVLWVARQERLGKPAIIPNSLWKNVPFTATCVAVFFTWAVFNALQYFATLYFQRVQGLSAIQTSIRFLPMVVVGAGTNVVTGFLVDKVEVRTLVVGSAVITLLPPILMAVIQLQWIYWSAAFVAMLLSPLHPDVLFTVSNLIISNAYPGKNQGLAGGVFNVMSQIGNSVGLAVTAAIAASVTAHETPKGQDPNSPEALLKGYHAAFWTMFASMVFVCCVTFWGLRKGGKVGGKRE